jgi:hypothetical protein
MKTWARVITLALFVLALASLSPGRVAAGNAGDKVTICHFPPGNPGNVQLITVGASGVAAHVAKHNDAVCASGASSCCFSGSGPSACVDFGSDSNNCGACGNACPATDTCVAGTCTPKEVADSCLPASSLSVLIQGTSVTAFVPQGFWYALSPHDIKAVPVEPAGGAATVFVTPAPVNSCSSNNVTATTVCTGNSNDLYVINGATMTTRTATATGSEFFSGGDCLTCGVAFDAATGRAWIAEGSTPPVGALQSFDPSIAAPGGFESPIFLFGPPTSESIQIDPVRKLILSANELNNWQIVKSDTGVVYNSTAVFPEPPNLLNGELDSTAEDCSTGVALAPFEVRTTVAFANLKGATYAGGVAGVSPGTWSAPTFIQDFAPDFEGLSSGNSGSAVAPGSHLAVITGEFGGSKLGVLQLPASIGPADTPAATDWVAADVPSPPETGIPWSMGFDPHTLTAYKSPNDGKAYALISNDANTFLVKVDLALLLSAPRLPAPLSHTADPATIPAGTFTFIAQ